ncbi:MAG: hypothetical protein XD76_0141 [candidate division TA06 bacterium 32_111]|uniref:Uncharacterized protein n=2 Tax=Bacteria candidate phyla TaxID=1783234 RepID=A0A101I3L8_UNCT6|nr:MAG: hypothetical protein XD76_0141 [candidate division TA06 bacterium 32_111]KUK88043.1 MAG: hypothetical protein XE03_0049 [candidate division TA06 bacterium 34_109]HAF06975.1 hypothetical protein [candidate division WOR-3 bacterium]HCP16889.1 hypothetical protein [candidate division WOR-3 bacterium]
MKKTFSIFFVISFLFLLNFSIYKKNIFLVIFSIISVVILSLVLSIYLLKEIRIFKRIFKMVIKNVDVIFEIFLKNFYLFFILIFSKNREEEIAERKLDLKNRNQIMNNFIKGIFSLDLSILKLYLTEEHLILKTKKIFNQNIYQLRYDRIAKRL